MYNSIYDFCKVKTKGAPYNSKTENPPRVKWILNKLDQLNITYELDKFENEYKDTFYNIYLKGSSSYGIMAHHDIVNPNSDNANDNSASVINLIAYKSKNPEINAFITDGEEPPIMGAGSRRVAKLIKRGYFGSIKSVLNLELTGFGGKNFFLGNYTGPLQSKIIDLFNPPVVDTPPSDTDMLRERGIDSTVIVTMNKKKDKIKDDDFWADDYWADLDLDLIPLFYCHYTKDSLSTINTDDMRTFTEQILPKILK